MKTNQRVILSLFLTCILLIIVLLIASCNGSKKFTTEKVTQTGTETVTIKPPVETIAFASNRDGDDEIYVMKTDGSHVVQLTINNYRDTLPSCSPDGQKITFQSNGTGDFEIFTMNADGSGV